jgi:hypothetical protein
MPSPLLKLPIEQIAIRKLVRTLAMAFAVDELTLVAISVVVVEDATPEHLAIRRHAPFALLVLDRHGYSATQSTQYLILPLST